MLHPDSTTVRLIYKHMIDEEMRRHQRPDQDDHRPPGPRRRPALVIRRATAHTLRTIASWIEPRPPIENTLPPTEPAV